MSFPIAHYVLFFLGIWMRNEVGFAITLENETILYENCTTLDNPDIHGGPVCGDDGVTYANNFYLDCKNYNSSEIVVMLHSGTCLKNEEYCHVNLYYDPVCGSDRKIYSNMRSLLCTRRKQSADLRAGSMKDCEQDDHCYRDSEHYGTNPVCASNGFTYQNAAQLKCLQRYNPKVKIMHDGGCRVEFVRRLYGSANRRICDMAKVKYEWNPVCASDGVTYSNPFLFLCYQSHLKAISHGECATHSQDSCVTAHTTISENGELANDAFTADDQVCGNDGRTYRSIHHLHCHTRRDKYVFLKHRGPCSGPDDDPCGSIPEEDHRESVCGSDGKSYVSPEALWCAELRYQEKNVTYKHDGPC